MKNFQWHQNRPMNFLCLFTFSDLVPSPWVSHYPSTCRKSVVDPEICPRGPDDSQNLRPAVVVIFSLTSFNRGGGPGPPGPPLDPLLENSCQSLRQKPAIGIKFVNKLKKITGVNFGVIGNFSLAWNVTSEKNRGKFLIEYGPGPYLDDFFYQI